MKDTKTHTGTSPQKHWLLTSGAVELFRLAPEVTSRFNDTFGFNLRYHGTPPERLDGDEQAAASVAFYVVRHNRLMPERLYCVYVIASEGKILARLGYIRDSNIHTIKDLESLSQVKDPQGKLYNWLRALLKASCEKPS